MGDFGLSARILSRKKRPFFRRNETKKLLAPNFLLISNNFGARRAED